MDKKIESLRKILEKVFSYLEIDPDFTIEDDPAKDSLAVKIWNEELSFLIGHRANCLKALRFFL
jgi:predicted RNA-binding protein Jag